MHNISLVSVYLGVFICMEDPHDEALVEQETAWTGCLFYDSVSSTSCGIISIFQSHLSTRPVAFSSKDLTVQHMWLVISFSTTTEGCKLQKRFLKIIFCTAPSFVWQNKYRNGHLNSPCKFGHLLALRDSSQSNHHIGRLTVTLRSAKIRSIMGFSLLSSTALLLLLPVHPNPMLVLRGAEMFQFHRPSQRLPDQTEDFI